MSEKIKELRHNHIEAELFFAKLLAYTLGPVELQKLMEKEDVKLIDVRRKEDYDISHIPSAVSIPKDELADNLGQLSKDQINVIYAYNTECHLGMRACMILAEYSYPTMLLDGGFKTWVEDFRFATSSNQA